MGWNQHNNRNRKTRGGGGACPGKKTQIFNRGAQIVKKEVRGTPHVRCVREVWRYFVPGTVKKKKNAVVQQ